jgi:endogenous inhibitor of DNA gyrase (YacG/DUF329 family)
MKAICEICKKEFNRSPQHIKRVKHIFCSRKCRGISHKGEGNPRWAEATKVCLTCGKKHKRKGLKYCSQKCMGIGRRNRLELKCGICGKNIIKPHIFEGTIRFCSKDCANKFHSKRIEKENNPNWKGGISNLPWGIEFNGKLKNKIRKRDGFKCRLCGKEKEALFDKKGCGLAVHHRDYDKNNNKENNLISLCNNCHGKTHYNREKWKIVLSKMLKD